MKRIIVALFMMLALTSIFAEGSKEVKNEERTLTVFAAASMTETLNKIGPLFEAANPGVTVRYNFDSSGTLRTQIKEGAVADVFISAGQSQMNDLEKLELLEPGSRVNLLENQVTLAVPAGNPKKINSFDELAKLLKDGSVLLAIGNSDVPVGQYTAQIIKHYGLAEEELAKSGKLTYGSNVKEVTTQVKAASVDAGIIYKTDAFSAGLEVVDSATKDMCSQVIYPAAVIKATEDKALASSFLSFIQGKEATEIFQSVGFEPVK